MYEVSVLLKNIKTQTMDDMEGFFNAYQQLLEFWCQPVPHVPFVQVVANVPLSFPSPSVQVFSPTGLSSLQLHVPVIYSNFCGFFTYYSVTDQTRPWEFCLALKITLSWEPYWVPVKQLEKKSAIWSPVSAVLRNHYTHQ